MKELSIFNQLRPITVGFDSVFDNFERMFSDDFFNTPSSYPAYNIVKTKDNHYDVEVALAGFNKKDIKVSYADGQLSIESVKMTRLKKRMKMESYIVVSQKDTSRKALVLLTTVKLKEQN